MLYDSGVFSEDDPFYRAKSNAQSFMAQNNVAPQGGFQASRSASEALSGAAGVGEQAELAGQALAGMANIQSAKIQGKAMERAAKTQANTQRQSAGMGLFGSIAKAVIPGLKLFG